MSALTYPDGIIYTAEHVWLRMEEDGTATVGITDFAQEQLGEVAFVDLPDAGAIFSAADEFGSVESLKAVSPLYMPIEGEVLAINEELSDTPTLVNMEPYEKGWMLRIKPAAEADSSALLDAIAYQAGL